MLQALLDARKQLDLTQEEMAKQLGISRNYLALIETNKRGIPASVKEWLVTHKKQIATDAVFLPASAPPREDTRPYACPNCADKNDEIFWLRKQIEELIGKLPSLKPTGPAATVCGAPRTDRSKTA